MLVIPLMFHLQAVRKSAGAKKTVIGVIKVAKRSGQKAKKAGGAPGKKGAKVSLMKPSESF